jgi:hypothetical protein
VIVDVLIQGNHITKPPIIFRELTFKKGDTITASQWPFLIERSRNNLRNTSLFNFVQIDTIRLASGELDAMIQVQERWYLFPSPILKLEERNVNTWWQQDDHRLDKLDYGGYVEYSNMFGQKQILKVRAQFGYTEQFGATYVIPYISQKQAGGLQFNFNYSLNHEIPYTSVNDILTYFNYPAQVLRTQYTGTIDYTYRQGLYNTLTFEADIFSCSVADTILKLTYDYLPFNQKQATFPEVKYYFKRDLRDYVPYPLKGYLFYAGFSDYGLGAHVADKAFNLFYVKASFRKYWQLSKRFYYSAEVAGKISQNGPQPYYLQDALGYYNDYIRGYELYVVDGNNYAIVKNEIKFQILDIPSQTVPIIGVKQFNTTYYSLYLTAFSDWGYVTGADPYVENNFLANATLWGNGLGLDFVTYYDLVFRFEYSLNKLGQSGFFVHFVAPM